MRKNEKMLGGTVIEELEKRNRELTERYRKVKQDNELLTGNLPTVYRIWPYLLPLHNNPFEVKYMPWDRGPYTKTTPDDY